MINELQPLSCQVNLANEWKSYLGCIKPDTVRSAIEEANYIIKNYKKLEIPYRLQPSVLDPSTKLLERLDPTLTNIPNLHRAIESAVNYVCKDKQIRKPTKYFSAKLVVKPTGCPGYNLHKDGDYWEEHPEKTACTIGVFLDDVRESSGPLMFPEDQGEGFVPLLVDRGGVIFFGSQVEHWSGPNVSGRDRKIIYVSFYTIQINGE